MEFEQGGKERAVYGDELLGKLSQDLTGKFGRGFSERNLEKYRGFYLAWPISPTLSAKSDEITAETSNTILSTVSGESLNPSSIDIRIACGVN